MINDPFIFTAVQGSLLWFIWRVTKPIRDDIRVNRYVKGKRFYA